MIVTTKNQAKKHIRLLLDEKYAVAFVKNHHFFMVLSVNSNSKVSALLNKAFNNDKKLIDHMVAVYKKLSSTYFTTTEFSNSKKTVTSEISLFTYLTDGCSHLKIYPLLNFNT